MNALRLVDGKRISYRSCRVYMAVFVVVAVREAALRVARRKGGVEKPVRYEICELAALCGLTEGKVRRDLKSLERAELLQFGEKGISVRSAPLPGLEELLQAVRSPLRPIPVPRVLLRFLAREHRQGVARTMIGYMIRGLTLSRRGETVNGKGSVKLSWIATVCGISERAAHYARAELIELGWISKDTGSTQLKLNRDGAYFEINVLWRPVRRDEISAPPPVRKPGVSAPPLKDRKTPNGSQNQKTSSGVEIRKTGRENVSKPANFKSVQMEDLLHLGRLETVYRDAARSGAVIPSESLALNFVAAAVRARRCKSGDAVRIFAGIVRRGLWHHITCEEEDIARRALARIREDAPERFRLSA